MTTAASLKEIQAPLKSKYRSDASAALVTLKSTGTLDSSSVTCKLSNSSAIKSASDKIAGLHPKAGGGDPELSGELCRALVACSGVTLKAVATALKIPLESGTVTAEGDMDFRGTLGVDKTVPVGMTHMRLGFDLKFAGDVTDDQVESLGQLTEKYCVVLQTIAKKPAVSVRVVGKGADAEDGIEKQSVWGRTL